MLWYIVIVFASSVVNFGSAFINPCHISYESCLKAAQAAFTVIASGVPELDMEPLDPLVLPTRIASNRGSLELEYRSSTIEGLRNCSIMGISFKSKQHAIKAKCHMVMQGQSSFHGFLLYHPLRGDGRFKIVLYEIIISSVARLGKFKGQDGKKHYNIKSWRQNFQVPKEPEFVFQNFELNNRYTNRSAANSFIRRHWRDVVQEFVAPLIRAAVTKIYEIIAQFLAAKPVNALALLN